MLNKDEEEARRRGVHTLKSDPILSQVQFSMRSQAYAALTSVLLWKCYYYWKDAFMQKGRTAWVIGSGSFLNN